MGWEDGTVKRGVGLAEGLPRSCRRLRVAVVAVSCSMRMRNWPTAEFSAVDDDDDASPRRKLPSNFLTFAGVVFLVIVIVVAFPPRGSVMYVRNCVAKGAVSSMVRVIGANSTITSKSRRMFSLCMTRDIRGLKKKATTTPNTHAHTKMGPQLNENQRSRAGCVVVVVCCCVASPSPLSFSPLSCRL